MFLGENYINLCHPDELNLEASFRKKKSYFRNRTNVLNFYRQRNNGISLIAPISNFQ